MKGKKERFEDDYFEYKEKGEVNILKLQCEDCSHQLKELYVCKKYTDRKPIGVLRCEEQCPKFEVKQCGCQKKPIAGQELSVDIIIR